MEITTTADLSALTLTDDELGQVYGGHEGNGPHNPRACAALEQEHGQG